MPVCRASGRCRAEADRSDRRSDDPLIDADRKILPHIAIDAEHAASGRILAIDDDDCRSSCSAKVSAEGQNGSPISLEFSASLMPRYMPSNAVNRMSADCDGCARSRAATASAPAADRRRRARRRRSSRRRRGLPQPAGGERDVLAGARDRGAVFQRQLDDVGEREQGLHERPRHPGEPHAGSSTGGPVTCSRCRDGARALRRGCGLRCVPRFAARPASAPGL